ncbi:MAG: MFS transporter [Micrococcus sp.]|nr:MFS transporter [Micrococcus sp.]
MTRSDPSPPADPDRRTRASGALLFVLLCAMGVGPLFNYGVSVSSAVIIEQLGLTAGQLGLVVSVVFASAAVTSIYLGRLADRMSARAQLVLIFAGTAVALVVGAFASHYWVLLLAAVLAGPAQAISNPTTNRIIIRAVPPVKRAGWIGVKQSGVQASQLFSGLFFPAVSLWLGWTGAALGAAVVAVGLLFYGLAVVPTPRELAARAAREAQSVPAPENTTPAAPDGARPADREGPPSGSAADRLPATVWIFASIALLSGFGMQATNVYLPLFSMEAVGFSLVLGGVATAVSGVIGVVSRIWWGRRMSAGVKASTLLLMIAAGALLGVAAFLAAGLWHVPALIWAGAALHGVTVLGANVVINAGLMQVVAPERIGAASGINSMGMYSGFALGPLVMGALRDLTGDFAIGWLIIAAMYLGCFGMAAFLRSHGRRHPQARVAQA